MSSPPEHTGSPKLHRSIERVPYTGLTVSGRPTLVVGLPNTARAAMCSGTLGGSGALNPTAGNGTAASTSTIDAPWEYPPSTSLVAGQLVTIHWMWPLASLAPPAAARKSQVAG